MTCHSSTGFHLYECIKAKTAIELYIHAKLVRQPEPDILKFVTHKKCSINPQKTEIAMGLMLLPY